MAAIQLLTITAQNDYGLLTVRVWKLVLYVFLKELQNYFLEVTSFISKCWEMLSDVPLRHACA